MNQGLAYEIAAVMPAATTTGLFVSSCTIMIPDGVFDAGGSPSGAYAAVAGLSMIPCMDAVPSMARIQATEVKALAEIMSKGLRHVLLNGSYPQILGLKQAGSVRCLVDGVYYELYGAEDDSQGTQTRLDMELVTV
jgi:hypothetical protein